MATAVRLRGQRLPGGGTHRERENVLRRIACAIVHKRVPGRFPPRRYSVPSDLLERGKDMLASDCRDSFSHGASAFRQETARVMAVQGPSFLSWATRAAGW